MITKELVAEYLQQITELDFYIVDIKVTPNMKITIYVDAFDGVKISDLTKIHKTIFPVIEEKEENFDLEVSSPGLTSLLKVWQQYFKLKEKNIQIVTIEGEVVDGKVINADEQKVEIKTKSENILTFEYSQIKKAKQIINI